MALLKGAGMSFVFFFSYVLEQSCQNNLRRRRVEQQEENTCKDFVLFVVVEFTLEKTMYIYVHMQFGVFFVVVFFFAETSPGVQFVTASLGNVVTERDHIYYNSVICPEDAQLRKTKRKKFIVLCSTWTLNVSFTSGSTKKVKDTVLSPLFCFC